MESRIARIWEEIKGPRQGGTKGLCCCDRHCEVGNESCPNDATIYLLRGRTEWVEDAVFADLSFCSVECLTNYFSSLVRVHA